MIEQSPIIGYEGETNPYEEVDYNEQARELVTTQFQNKDVVLRYLQLLLSGREELQSTVKQLMQDRSLDSSEGEQLDIIGDIVGQPRTLLNSTTIPYFGFEGATGASPYRSISDTERTFGPYKSVRDPLFGARELTDREYRRILRLKILKNTSQADITSFIDGCVEIFGVDSVNYEELEGQIIINIGRLYNDPELAAFPGLDEIELGERFLNKPLGILIGYKEPFSFSADFVNQQFRVFDAETSTTVLVNFSELFNFTRPYEADYYDQTGTLVTASIDEPRFDYNPSTLEANGLLMEPTDEQLTRTWDVEIDNNLGTFTITVEQLADTMDAQLAFITQSSDFVVALYREEKLWKLRVENGVEGDNLVIPEYTSDEITVKLAYNGDFISVYINNDYRLVDIDTAVGGSNLQGYQMRVGGDFTTSDGYTLNHFDGYLKLISYETEYTGGGRVVESPSNLITESDNILKTESDDFIMIEGYGLLA
jgi:hypothetical protein